MVPLLLDNWRALDCCALELLVCSKVELDDEPLLIVSYVATTVDLTIDVVDSEELDVSVAMVLPVSVAVPIHADKKSKAKQNPNRGKCLIALPAVSKEKLGY